MSEWVAVARSLVADGFDSSELVDFAGLDAADGADLAALMPDVLRSLGLVVAEGPPFYEQLFELSGFADRCRSAIAVVQSDLDRTGYGEFRMQPIDVSGYEYDPDQPMEACAGLANGWSGSEENNPMSADLDDEDLIGLAARTTCDTLLLAAETRWPRCVEHRTRYLIPGSPPERRSATGVWWWCNAVGAMHPVAPIGGLTRVP